MMNVVLSVLLFPVASFIYSELDEIVGFIADHVYLMLALGFFGKLISKLVFALAFLPIGTLYKLVHALIPRGCRSTERIPSSSARRQAC